MTNTSCRATRFVAQLAAVSIVLAVSVLPALAQPCPGATAVASGVMANKSALGAGPTTSSFVGTGSNCTGMASGAATQCNQFFSSLGPNNAFTAQWASMTARTNDAVGGCLFMCPGGSCRVANDGLPVELLDFQVR